MSLSNRVRIAAHNIAFLFLAATPAFILLAWLQAFLLGWEGSADIGNVLTIIGFYLLVFAGPVLLGGVAHNVLVLSLPLEWAEATRRRVAFGTTVLIPLVVGLMLDPDYVLIWYAAPMLVGLTAYGVAFRLPQAPEPGE